MRAEQKGVTLIELMTVIGIIGILGTIALSSYRNSVVRANRADATTALVRLAGRQEKLYMVNNTYADTPTLAALKLDSSERGYYTITIAPNPVLTTGFLATATPVAGGPQAADTVCATLGLDETGQHTFTGTGTLAECWK